MWNTVARPDLYSTKNQLLPLYSLLQVKAHILIRSKYLEWSQVYPEHKSKATVRSWASHFYEEKKVLMVHICVIFWKQNWPWKDHKPLCVLFPTTWAYVSECILWSFNMNQNIWLPGWLNAINENCNSLFLTLGPGPRRLLGSSCYCSRFLLWAFVSKI